MHLRHTTLTQAGIQLIRGAALGCLLVALSVCGLAQGGFVSGSTGADGAFNPTAYTNVQIPESGVFNFTTITIPTGVNIDFKKNSRNTPVVMLATGDVIIRGALYVNGQFAVTNTGYAGEGGPGGFRGGDSGWPTEHPDGFPGNGPGGALGGKRDFNTPNYTLGNPAGHRYAGDDTNGNGGQAYGNSNLSLLVGGSGGSGSSAGINYVGEGGGGGGGAILIASSTVIRFEGGAIYAYGGSSRANGSGGGGGGSGGSIRLVGNSIIGAALFDIRGGQGSSGTAVNFIASKGRIRVEAFDLTQFTSSDYDFSRGLPSPAILPNPPSLRITAVGGVNAPANPAASFAANPDIIVPTTVTNPVTVSIQASNIPIGTVVQVTQTTETNTKTTVNSTPLTGTTANSTATVSVTLPTSGMSVLTATTTLNALVAFGRPIHINGKRIENVEIGANFGGSSQVTYITAKGERLKWPQ